MVIKAVGPIVSNEYGSIYDWLGWDCICPNKISNAIKNLGNGEELEINLSSPGGYTDVASQIYSELRGCKNKTIINIVGEACSAATVIMCAADVTRAINTATFMYHNASTCASGKSRDLHSAAECLDKTDASIINAYQLKTGKSRDELKDLMDKESWMSMQDAMEYGFVDEEYSPDGKETSLDAVAVQSNATLLTKNSFEQLKAAMIAQKTTVQTEGSEEDVSDISNNPVVDINQKQAHQKEGGTKIMTLAELLEQNPEAKAEHERLISNAKKEGVTAGKEEGAKDERNRIQSIEAISKSIPSDMLVAAKFEKPMDAATLALQALQSDNAKAKAYMQNAKGDAAESGTEDVITEPDEEEDDDEKVADAFAKHVNALKRK